jgi:hypothetical protein
LFTPRTSSFRTRRKIRGNDQGEQRNFFSGKKKFAALIKYKNFEEKFVLKMS